MDFEQVISQLADDVRAIRAEDAATKTAPHEARRGSRYVGQGADPSFAQEIAAGGELRLAERQSTRLSHKVPGGGLAGVFTKALSEGTGSSGGFLVPVEVSAEVVRLIRARSAIAKLGPRVVPVSKELAVTSISTGATAYYVAENAAIPVSEESFAQAVLLRPKELAALVPVSNRL
ncbi:MAG: phage major capsid protein, partial [Actinobacteria bacterium]|nr:phage major capsid protein [Actinomycetota bacterium]